MTVFRLKNWAIGSDGHAYMAPEQIRLSAYGEVYDNPKFEDGTTIRTSDIEKSEGRDLLTKSGSVYRLEGDPDPDYLVHLEKIGYEIDLDNPVKFRRIDDE